MPEGALEDPAEVGVLPVMVSDVVQAMCDDEYNTVCVVSGRNKETMKAEFDHIENVYIAAENGYYYGRNDFEKPIEFEKLIGVEDWGWKGVAHTIMKSYKERTDGSFITEDETRIRWYFRDVEADFAKKEANELIAHLRAMLENFQVDIVKHKDSVEVKPTGLDKGAFVKRLFEIVEAKKGKVDFVLCIGDNDTDEFMFKEVKKHADPQGTFCITVGMKVSLAEYYFNDQNEVSTLLSEIVITAIEVKVALTA
eukprot:TRINITY_DN5734_c0_g7_i2.p3 TRINITY_DN5734_c0_g7~~TRINITY_DN5734_c0_g7_i2.p3  ORF type:complete len:253 (+),score=95.06 TRINITY_DN5734_c0_g7_i2:2360-3118(+)